MSEYRGEARPRRQPTRHHIITYSAAHDTRPVDDPFPPISNKQFPSMYMRSMTKNAYRGYMRAKAPYSRHRS